MNREFEEELLEINSIGCVLFSLNKNNGILIKDLIFYYCLAIFRINRLYSLDFLYTKARKNINRIYLELYMLGFVEITRLNKDDLLLSLICLTSSGKEYISQLESQYFIRIQNEIKVIKKEYPSVYKYNFTEVGMYENK